MEFSRNYPLPPGRTTTAEHCQNQLTNLHEQKQSVSRTMLDKTNVYNLCVGMESPSQISIIASTRKKISENLSLPEQAQSSILPGWNLYYLSSPTKKWCEEITDREWKTLRDVFDSSNKILNYTPNIKRASQSAHFYNQCKKSNLAGKVNP